MEKVYFAVRTEGKQTRMTQLAVEKAIGTILTGVNNNFVDMSRGVIVNNHSDERMKVHPSPRMTLGPFGIKEAIILITCLTSH